MNVSDHQIAQGLINHAVTCNGVTSGKGRGNDTQAVVTAAVARARVSCMQRAIVADFDLVGREGFDQTAVNAFGNGLAHGSTFLNGRTL